MCEYSLDFRHTVNIEWRCEKQNISIIASNISNYFIQSTSRTRTSLAFGRALSKSMCHTIVFEQVCALMVVIAFVEARARVIELIN